MANINKSDTLRNASLIKTINTDYMSTMNIFMDGCDTSRALADAIESCGFDIGDDHPDKDNLDGLQVVAIEALPVSDTQVNVLVRFGTPQVSITYDTDQNIKWAYETSGAVRQVQSSFDKDKKAIVVKHQPLISAAGDPVAYMADADWNLPNNQRRYKRMMTATKYLPWAIARLRARIHWSWVERNEDYDPAGFAALLGGKYNKDITKNGVTLPGKTWMVQSCTCTTPNQGIIYEVSLDLAYNPYGWDPFVIFIDPLWHSIPAEIYDALIANPDLTKPNHTITEIAAKPYGCTRPYMAEEADFITRPLGIDFGRITGISALRNGDQ